MVFKTFGICRTLLKNITMRPFAKLGKSTSSLQNDSKSCFGCVIKTSVLEINQIHDTFLVFRFSVLPIFLELQYSLPTALKILKSFLTFFFSKYYELY